MTNELLINRFLNHLRRDRKSVLTLSAYATDLKQFSAAISPTSITHLTNPKLTTCNQQFISHFSPNSRARKLTSIREFLHWCHRQGYITLDLSKHIDRPARQTQHPAKPLSQTQIARLRRHANDLERLVLELLLQTGMRLKDVVRLHMRDVDMNNRKLFLSSSTARFSTTLTDHLYQALSYYLSSNSTSLGAVVTSPRGKKISIRTATQLLANLSKKAHVRHATPRNLRATFIVRQIESGTPIEIIQQSTGYATIAPLQKYLAQTRPLSHNRKIELAEI